MFPYHSPDAVHRRMLLPRISYPLSQLYVTTELKAVGLLRLLNVTSPLLGTGGVSQRTTVLSQYLEQTNYWLVFIVHNTLNP